MKIVNGFDLLAYAKEKKLLLPASTRRIWK